MVVHDSGGCRCSPWLIIVCKVMHMMTKLLISMADVFEASEGLSVLAALTTCLRKCLRLQQVAYRVATSGTRQFASQ
jgi:hypothetical protein